MNVPRKINRNIILSIVLLLGITFSVVRILMAAAPDPGHNFTQVSGGVVQGDLLYGSATDALSALTKDANATRYLSNQGTSNNPSWNQVNLANGVTGVLADGNITSTLTGKTYNALTLTSQAVGFTIAGGTTSKTLTITGDATISGTPFSNPMTTGGDIIYGGASGVATRLANGSSGQVLQSNGTTLAPSWVTPGATGANTALSNLASVAINTDLIGAVTGGLGIRGGTAANDDLILEGTTNATRTTSYVNLQPNGGFVGIGTATPAASLDVRSSSNEIARIQGTGGNAQVRIVRDDTTAGGVSNATFLTFATTNDGTFWNMGNDLAAAGTSNFGIGTGGGEKFTILGASGFVGIGTTNPQARLHIEGGQARLALFDNDLAISSANPAWIVRALQTGFYAVGTTSDYAAITDRFTIDSTGNVGIGPTTPTAVLHLKAGTATANTAPLKFTSGTLLSTAEAGAIEFLTDAYYGTITTGAARKTFAFLESPIFTGTPTLPTGTIATTQTAGNNTTAVATTAFVTAINNNASYRTILEASGSHTAAKATGTYGMGHGDPLAISGTGTLYPLAVIYIAAADYPTINGITTKMRIRAQLYTNDVAPTGTYTFGLCPITRPATSGGAAVDTYTIGAPVTGSDGATFVSPAADLLGTAVGSDFAIPADGPYVICMVQTIASVATSAHIHMDAQLQMRNN